jgi:tRNA-dihydrouridine synthase 3
LLDNSANTKANADKKLLLNGNVHHHNNGLNEIEKTLKATLKADRKTIENEVKRHHSESEDKKESEEASDKNKKFKKEENKKSDSKSHSELCKRDRNLCVNISKCVSCPYGSACKYSHDAKSWYDMRSVDIGSDCYIFDSYGYCPFGLSCRFGSKHVRLNEDNTFENLVNDSKLGNLEKEKVLTCKIYNLLGNELKNKLWKKKYDFNLSNKIVNTINKYVSSSIKYNKNRGILKIRVTLF